MNEPQLTCRTCFVTSNFPGADIDETGQCHFCRQGQFSKSIQAETEDLDALRLVADRIKQHSTGKYDCVIGISGGLDSSYVAYIAKHQMGLRPLLIHYDHGFFYDFPAENINNLVNSLGCELRNIKSVHSWDKKYVREIQKAFSRSKLYWGICSFCHYILPAVVARIARDEGIKFILTSTNDYEGILHVPKMAKLKAMLRSISKAGISSLPGMIYHLLLSQYYLLRLKLEFYVPPLTNLFRRGPKTGLENVNVTAFVPWEIEKMRRVLGDETGWHLPQHPNLGMRFDCMIEDSFINHTYKQATGSTIHSIVANNLVYDGLAQKEDLQPVVSHYDQVIEDRMQQVMSILKEG